MQTMAVVHQFWIMAGDHLGWSVISVSFWGYMEFSRYVVGVTFGWVVFMYGEYHPWLCCDQVWWSHPRLLKIELLCSKNCFVTFGCAVLVHHSQVLVPGCARSSLADSRCSRSLNTCQIAQLLTGLFYKWQSVCDNLHLIWSPPITSDDLGQKLYTLQQ